MSVTPRASGFWSTTGRMSYFDTGNDGEEEELVEGGEDELETVCDGRTPLDRTIDRIGMGAYVSGATNLVL